MKTMSVDAAGFASEFVVGHSSSSASSAAGFPVANQLQDDLSDLILSAKSLKGIQ
jgi:hypothetical protein